MRRERKSMTGQSIRDSFDSMTFADGVEGRKSIVIKKKPKTTYTRRIRTNNREAREIEVAGGEARASEVSGFAFRQKPQGF